MDRSKNPPDQKYSVIFLWDMVCLSRKPASIHCSNGMLSLLWSLPKASSKVA